MSFSKSIVWVLVVLHALVCSHIPLADGARILGLFATPAPSHHMMFQALMKALAERGHYVEVASPCPLTTPPPKNYKDVALPVPDIDKRSVLEALAGPDSNPIKEHIGLWSMSKNVCETQLASPELQRYLKNDPGSFKFDLIFVEVFFYDCLIGFAHHFNVPVIAMISQFSLPWAYDLVGNPQAYSHVPVIAVPYGERMTFFERLCNTLFSVGSTFARRFIALPIQNKVAQQYFGANMPPLWEMERNISLVFTNGHPATSPIQPRMPNLVELAGMHILEKPPQLPWELQELMDSNSKVILFSLGTLIDNTTITTNRLETLLTAFKNLDAKVIWKWDGEVNELPIPLPANVHVFKWLPQQSLLAHQNLVAFVTHGGLLSVQEATYHGVPLIGFPFYGDQAMNLRHVADVGMGLNLNFHTFTADELVNALHEVIYNPRFLSNAKKLSSVFRDQPETPLQRGVYWTEYVIRHKGAPHLRSAAMDLNWFQHNHIDIFAFVILIMAIIAWIIYYTIKAIVSFFSKKEREKKRKSKHS